jgi:hypothetical protein
MSRRLGQINKDKRYHQLSWDIFAALTHAKLGVYEWAVVRYVIKHSWTLPRLHRKSEHAVAVPIPCSAIAIQEHLDRSCISAAVTSLVRHGILIRTPEGHLINKVAGEWVTSSGEPRLTPERLQFCIDETRGDRCEVTTGPVVNQQQPVVHSQQTRCEPTTLLLSVHNSPVVNEQQVSEPPLEPPTGERAQEELIQNKREEAAADAGEEERLTRRISDVLIDATKNSDAWTWVNHWKASGHPLAEIRAAVDAGIAANLREPKKVRPYSNQILERRRREGYKAQPDLVPFRRPELAAARGPAYELYVPPAPSEGPPRAPGPMFADLIAKGRRAR